ncbi:hypothetical protein PVAP13_9KG489900 [Panicum virgatum]|uniref:Uncharacterized protein n=1 Tax=Panicum virgatum TaxID=38727 RepID=A0A8T0P0L7_PANVG|nr:hypothetical protein PVAP13_9KG489900 [Panicum virgatum]
MDSTSIEAICFSLSVPAGGGRCCRGLFPPSQRHSFPADAGCSHGPPLFILLVLIPKPAAVVRVTRLRQHVVIRQVLSVCGEVHLDFVRFEPFLCERCRVERASLSIGHRH